MEVKENLDKKDEFEEINANANANANENAEIEMEEYEEDENSNIQIDPQILTEEEINNK
jgi:hypothetical protein